MFLEHSNNNSCSKQPDFLSSPPSQAEAKASRIARAAPKATSRIGAEERKRERCEQLAQEQAKREQAKRERISKHQESVRSNEERRERAKQKAKIAAVTS